MKLKDVDYTDLIDEKYMLKEVNKGVFLTQNQIDILLKYDIDPKICTSIKEIMYIIEEILLEDYYEDLETILIEISDFNYYTNTNK